MALPPLVHETWSILIVGKDAASPPVVIDPTRGVVIAVGNGSLKSAFRDACNKPLVGKPRRPKVVRVASEAAQAELRGAMPGVAVEVALPSEELIERARAHLRREAPTEGPTTWGYSLDTFEGMLALAEDLTACTPWNHLSDQDHLTLRAPDHGIEEGEIIVLGNAGTQFGFLVFKTLELADEFRAFCMARPSEPFDTTLSGPHHAFTLEGSDVISAPMRKAADRLGFEAMGYPVPVCIAPDLQVRRARADEVATLLAAGRALCVLADREEESLAAARPAFVEYEGVIVLSHGRTQAPADVVPIHGGPVADPPDDGGATWRADDFALLHALTALADETLGPDWRAAAPPSIAASGPSPEPGLTLWPTLLAEPRGASTALAELRLRHPATFDPHAEAILAAEAVAWTGLWEVLSVAPGQGFEARDLFSHEARFVSDVAASRSVTVRTVICARVPTIGEHSWLAAADPRGLSPYHADRVRTAAAERLRWPKTRAVPIGKLLDARAQRLVASLWAEAVDAALDAPAPTVRTTDGEVFEPVTDRFRGRRLDLTKVEGVVPPSAGQARWSVRTGAGPTALSDLHVEGDELRVESLSVAQADRVRARIEAALGGFVAHTERTVRSLAEVLASRRERPSARLSAVASEAEQQAILQMKADHYATWPDVPLQALDGKTPRQAAALKRGRVQLERLIADMEHHERQEPPGTHFDFDPMRLALGLR